MRVNPDALRAIQTRSGLSITELAGAVGVRQSHMSNLIAGRRNASPKVILAIADALRVPVTAIILVPDESETRAPEATA